MKHIPIVCQQLLDDFDAVGQPYLQACSSKDYVLECLMRDTKILKLGFPFLLAQAKMALAIAYTLDDPLVINQVIDRQREFLRQRESTLIALKDIQDFEAFIAALKEYN